MTEEKQTRNVYLELDLSQILRDCGRSIRVQEGPVIDLEYFVDVAKNKVVYRLLVEQRKEQVLASGALPFANPIKVN